MSIRWIALSIVLALVGFMAGREYEENRYQIEAVRRGHGEFLYRATGPNIGQRVFHWRTRDGRLDSPDL